MKSTTVLLLLALAAMIFTVIESNPVNESVDDVIDIESMKEAAKSFKICSKCPIQEQCDSRLGCFFTYGPLGFLPLLPSTADDIGTEFFAYKPDSHGTQHLLDMDKSDTFKVIDNHKHIAILIHGYTESYRCEVLVNLKNTILQMEHENIGTVIMVNWENGCKSPNYPRAAANTQVVGAQVAHLVNELIHKHHVDPKKVYLIGFSLGAQVAGHAGKYSQKNFGWKFGRITGCDAASPAFEGNPGSYLTKDDADFVDAIHTAMGIQIVGFETPYAHLDFFPNGGNFQPDCGLDISCSHRRSVQLFEASIKARNQCKFPGYPCPSLSALRDGQCPNSDSLMGYPSDHFKNSTGSQYEHYLITKGKFPYCNI